MDVVVAGSSGLIGTAFCAALEQRGHTVVRLVRRPPHEGEIRWDIDAGTIDSGGLEGVDAVVNIAGEPLAKKKWTPAQKLRITDSRVEATALLSGALANLESKPKVFLSGSAVGVYGDRGDELLTEGSASGTGYLAEMVTDWEAATEPASDAGIRAVLLRTGIVVSKDGGAVGEQLPFFKVGLGGRIGSGQQYWSWISIVDQVGAMLHLLEGDVVGPVNLTAPTPVTNRDFVTAIGKALGRPTFLPTPTFALYLKLGKEMVTEMLFASQRALPSRLLDSGYEFEFSTIDDAVRHELGR